METQGQKVRNKRNRRDRWVQEGKER